MRLLKIKLAFLREGGADKFRRKFTVQSLARIKRISLFPAKFIVNLTELRAFFTRL
ncbi:hypothetical protein CAMRE0001_1087 [Campylobacter rectus RM3267]|uniref:Uncharacterized protein n=1 Tax=Campylobacter rectus RM3267 TaxID=553218 RepID=B9D5H6_CAMRE|nr:hypothetical protein CAMRE0001_1087 [Campylobacter rectus RM3267]